MVDAHWVPNQFSRFATLLPVMTRVDFDCYWSGPRTPTVWAQYTLAPHPDPTPDPCVRDQSHISDWFYLLLDRFLHLINKQFSHQSVEVPLCIASPNLLPQPSKNVYYSIFQPQFRYTSNILTNHLI